jgi:hypothetical protein
MNNNSNLSIICSVPSRATGHQCDAETRHVGEAPTISCRPHQLQPRESLPTGPMELNTRAALVALLFSTAATAHEHHMNKIKAGDAVSADPIVC